MNPPLTDILDLFLIANTVQNTPFWAVLAIFGVLLVCWIRSRRRRSESGQTLGMVQKLLASSLFLVFVGLGGFLNAGYALYIGYVAPRDIMQDIVSAQEFLQGKPLYPPKMTDLIRASLEKEPAPLSLGKWWTRLQRIERWEFQRNVTAHWVQAHPPLMTLFIAPFVAFFGVHGTYLTISMLSMGALFLSVILLRRELGLELSRLQTAILGLAILGWAPVLSVLRNGQSGILLGALIVVGWFGLRHGYPVLAGMTIGTATCLKLYPGLLLFYLLVRHRRAFVTAFLTILFLLWIPGVLSGWQNYLDYFHTIRRVVIAHEANLYNLSLWGLLARVVGGSIRRSTTGRMLFIGLELVIVGALAWMVRHASEWKGGNTQALDLEYSLFVTLMPLLSPFTWQHYLPILLLPLAVLGQQILKNTPHLVSWSGWFGILVILSIPESALPWLFKSLQDSIGRLWLNLLLVPLPTFALIALGLWIVALYVHNKRSSILFFTTEARRTRRM